MLISKYNFEIFADYHQFYLEDEKSLHKTDIIWNEKTVEQMLATEENLVAIGTARNMEVSVSVEIHTDTPVLELENFSRINECSLKIISNKLVILGCTDYFPDAPRIEIEPDIYRVRILYGNLESVNDLDGEDFYILQLWKDADFREIKTLKP